MVGCAIKCKVRNERKIIGSRFLSFFGSKLACVFRLCVSMRKVASGHPFCVLRYINSLHIYFILIILLSYLIFDFICLTLSLADTHGIAKYARTHIRRHTHTHTPKKKSWNEKRNTLVNFFFQLSSQSTLLTAKEKPDFDSVRIHSGPGCEK